MGTAIRSLRPDTMEFPDYRVGKMVEINGASSTVRVRMATGFYRNKTARRQVSQAAPR